MRPMRVLLVVSFSPKGCTICGEFVAWDAARDAQAIEEGLEAQGGGGLAQEMTE